MFAAEIRSKRIQHLRAHSNRQCHLDEIFVKIESESNYLWRAVDHEALGSQIGIEIPQIDNEARRPVACHRDRSTTVLWRCHEGHWERKSPENRPLVEQSRRDLPLTFPKVRASHAAVLTNANLAEVRLSPRLGPLPFQPGASALLTD